MITRAIAFLSFLAGGWLEASAQSVRPELPAYRLFPEKREFFLDGANYFEFPGGDESPFFSRRIGLNSGEPQPIAYGAKLTGQMGRQDIGFLHVSTSEQDFARGGENITLKGEAFTVARVRHRFGSQSSLGMRYTRRAARDSIVEPRHSAGTDLALATPDFIGESTLDSGAWYVAHLETGIHQRGPRNVAGGPLRFVRVVRERLERSVSCRSVVPGRLSNEFNDVNLPQGSFSTKLYRLDARTQLSPWISLSNNVQFDSESGQVGWQLRFRWIQKPGNDVFVIWTQNWQEGIGSRFAALDRRGAAKIVRTFRF